MHRFPNFHRMLPSSSPSPHRLQCFRVDNRIRRVWLAILTFPSPTTIRTLRFTLVGMGRLFVGSRIQKLLKAMVRCWRGHMTGHKQPNAVRRLITCRTCRIVKVSTATALTNPTIRRPFPFEGITPGTLPCSIFRRQIRMFIIDVNVFYEGRKVSFIQWRGSRISKAPVPTHCIMCHAMISASNANS